MKIDATGRVISFAEKPKGADLKAMVSSRSTPLSTLLSDLVIPIQGGGCQDFGALPVIDVVLGHLWAGSQGFLS